VHERPVDVGMTDGDDGSGRLLVVEARSAPSPSASGRAAVRMFCEGDLTHLDEVLAPRTIDRKDPENSEGCPHVRRGSPRASRCRRPA